MWATTVACPHCAVPLRLTLTVGRTQCVVDVSRDSYAAALQVRPDGVGEAVHALSTGVADVQWAEAPTVTEGHRVLIPPVGVDLNIGASADVFPAERGFDDDEAPFPPPPQGQMDLF